MARFRVGFRKPNITRVVVKIVTTVLALWIGGEIMTQIGNTMTCTYSPFYTGLSMIGWTIASVTSNGSTYTGTCYTAPWGLTAGTYNNVITATTGTGVLGVIGLIGIASVILEFVKFRM